MKTTEPALAQKKSNRPDLPVPMSFEDYKKKRLPTYEQYVEEMTPAIQKHMPDLFNPESFKKAYEDYTRSSYNGYLHHLGGADYVDLL